VHYEVTFVGSHSSHKTVLVLLVLDFYVAGTVSELPLLSRHLTILPVSDSVFEHMEKIEDLHVDSITISFLSVTNL
jgi:hypothetical protein